MAVSFKVPKSPKRDIFNIDTFLGVDLTNTGSNIDEIRSPNAENMVRYVPGKVRKRTGYQTNVLFSDGKDINRAKNTSDEWVEVTDWGDDDGCYICDFYNTLSKTYVLVWVECVGEYCYYLKLTESQYLSTPSVHFSGTEENPYVGRRWWFPPYSTYKTTGFGFTRFSHGENDYLKFKCLMVCEDTNAESVDIWKDLPWTPAPEDTGSHFCKTDKSAPVYGCHILRNGSFDGNRVVNVNRALNTSNEFQTFNITSTRSTLYNLGEAIYRTADSYRLVDTYIDFDYILSGDDTWVLVAGVGYGGGATLTDTNGETKHYSLRIPTGSYTNYDVMAGTESGTANTSTLQIKNLTVCYQKDDKYRWSKAPEDNGDTFHTEDIYNIGRENHSMIDSYSDIRTSTLTQEKSWGHIGDANHYVNGFSRVAFDLNTASSSQPTSIQVQLWSNTNVIVSEESFSNNISKRHFEYYVSAGASDRYIKYIVVVTNYSTTGIDFDVDITNIEYNEISPKEYYSISSKNYIYHVGSDFWFRPSNESSFKKIYSAANKRLSRSWQLNDNLYIIDGQDIYTYAIGDERAIPLTEIGKIPLVTIAKSPTGGGTAYDALNMLQPGFEERFLVSESEQTAKEFQLSFGQLDQTETKAWVMDSHGNWIPKIEGTDYTVNRGTGTITFVTAPGKTPSGEDNVRIIAYRTVEGYADRVRKCTVGALFGVGGAGDRLFLSGNPDYPNWDFYSEQFDPTYFPDLGYSVMGSAASAIVGYAIINNYLAAFKDEYDESQSVFIREGDMVVNSVTNVSEPAFKLINTLQGNGVIAPYSFGYLTTEPLFLTRSGIYAITVQDITGEKYSQNRSFYLDGQLTKEDNLQNAVAVVFKDQYVLAINGSLYILDGIQPVRTDKSMPYSTRQYAGFYCTNVPAICLWTDDQALWFGTNDGRACRFATEIESLDSYNDDGEPIYACWETPDLDGKLFYKNKTFRYFAVRMMSAIKTSVKMFSQRLGEWTFIKETTAISKIFDFNDIDFNLFTFRSDSSEKVAHAKVRVKKVDKARFRVENGNLNEPFGLFDLALEYIESGNYKR